MELNPYLTFNGQCEAAFKFYESAWRQDRSDDDLRQLAHGGANTAAMTQQDHACAYERGRQNADGIRRPTRPP